MPDRIRKFLISVLAVFLSVFTIYEVNYSLLSPLKQLAVFALIGIVLCLLIYPLDKRLETVSWLRIVDLLLSMGFVGCCSYVLWEGDALTNQRVGQYTASDHLVAIAATLLVLEATRRSIGWALPILASLFLLYAFYGASLPDWIFPHRGYDIDRIASQCFLGTKGILGVAMRVMLTYVYLFVVFGAFLEMSGATQFIIDFSNRVFGRTAGGPAKVAVLGSGLMGSLSGSAVANAVTTGTFTIPMMRSAGFAPHISGGITAAAASGGALVPPVMGAGAYMMLEIIDPPVAGFMQIVRAALVPAILYYLSILLIVHFYARRLGARKVDSQGMQTRRSLLQYEGIVFFSALAALIGFLYAGYTPFRSVTYALVVIFLLTVFSPNLEVKRFGRLLIAGVFLGAMLAAAAHRTGDDRTQLQDWSIWANAAIPAMLTALLAGLCLSDWRGKIMEAFLKSARGGIALISASGCVGIIMGVVSLTGVGTAFPNEIVPLAEESLLLALIAIMFCSIVLGMGLPSAVCYLLMAVLIGPVLNRLGIIPLAAHLFIFYFGMMSMVTPPVALAAYASASIARAKVMPTALAGFRFSLVGFTLPFMFVYRPALLLLDDTKWRLWMTAKDTGAPEAAELLKAANTAMPGIMDFGIALTAAVLGIVSLAAGIAGYLRTCLVMPLRLLCLVAAALLLLPELKLGETQMGPTMNVAGGLLFGVIVVCSWRTTKSATPNGDVANPRIAPTPRE